MSNEDDEKKPEFVTKISKFIPSIGKPDYKQSLNSRLKWSGIALLCYFLLLHITVVGIQQSEYFKQLSYVQMVLGAKFGSLVTLGIGPIVTAGIILQLLVGSKIIKWDTTKPEGRKKFQSWNKILGFSLCFIEAAAFVLAGAIPTDNIILLKLFVILQIAAGGMIVILLDDLVSKWGFGSGVSLFIAAGVASQMFVTLLSPLPSIPTESVTEALANGKVVGDVPKIIINLINGNMYNVLISTIPIVTTAIAFFVVLYVSGIHVEVPLAFSSMRGFGRTWSLKFLYSSVIPVIFISALLANVQILGKMGTTTAEDGSVCGFLGCFDSQGSAKSGAVYYLTSPHNIIIQLTQNTFVGTEILRAFTYLIFLSVGAMIFSIFWVNTAGMDAKSVAGQLDSSGLQIPGYRKDPRIMESVLHRYIPALTVMGGIGIGILAAGADFMGVIGSGTGILLTIMILHDLYEKLKHENLEEAHPLLRKIVGE
jgi:preprotein translocase subunit SecY